MGKAVSERNCSVESYTRAERGDGLEAYQLLVKERMMGLYLAVYVNRNIRGLVKGMSRYSCTLTLHLNSLLGTSRSAVTAGLIGGRVGNKGGIGISINLDGTTLLFMNAHLAGSTFLRPFSCCR
jgi:hypothetical protein